MIFNSLTYLFLLFTVVLLYWLLPYRIRLLLIFSSSLIFYGFWRVEFLPVMLISVIVDYVVSIRMPQSTQQTKKRLLLISLVVNLGLLFYFKYLIFFSENAVGLANLLGAEVDPLVLKIILPLGISFYTFQSISYTIDIYRKKTNPTKNFILFANYVTFFPQLIAGPILRSHEVIKQLQKNNKFKIDNLINGIKKIGPFQSIIISLYSIIVSLIPSTKIEIIKT